MFVKRARDTPLNFHCKYITQASLWQYRFRTLRRKYYLQTHDDVIKWKHSPRYWPFVRGIHRSPVNSPHKSQWRGTLMFSLICVWINGWVNNREASDLRRYRAHYHVTVMTYWGANIWPYFPYIQTAARNLVALILQWETYLTYDPLAGKFVIHILLSKSTSSTMQYQRFLWQLQWLQRPLHWLLWQCYGQWAMWSSINTIVWIITIVI